MRFEKHFIAGVLLAITPGCSTDNSFPPFSELQKQSGYQIGRLWNKSWQPPPCEEMYRGVYIDCRPSDPKDIGEYKQHIKTAEQLRIECRKYIDKTYFSKNRKFSLGKIRMGCHQMTGGPLVIDGAGQQ